MTRSRISVINAISKTFPEMNDNGVLRTRLVRLQMYKLRMFIFLTCFLDADVLNMAS